MKSLISSLFVLTFLTLSLQAQDAHEQDRSNIAPVESQTPAIAPATTPAAPATPSTPVTPAATPTPATEAPAATDTHGEIEQLGEGDSEYSTPAPDAPAATTTPAVADPAKPKPAPKPKVIPSRHGDCSGEAWRAHRMSYKRYAGWGFVKPEEEKGWGKAKWVLIEEDPMAGKIIPSRFLNKINADQDYEYRFYGEMMPYKGYEPNYDIFVDVFRIRGFELLGKAAEIDRKPPRGAGSSRKSRISEGGARTNPFQRR